MPLRKFTTLLVNGKRDHSDSVPALSEQEAAEFVETLNRHNSQSLAKVIHMLERQLDGGAFSSTKPRKEDIAKAQAQLDIAKEIYDQREAERVAREAERVAREVEKVAIDTMGPSELTAQSKTYQLALATFGQHPNQSPEELLKDAQDILKEKQTVALYGQETNAALIEISSGLFLKQKAAETSGEPYSPNFKEALVGLPAQEVQAYVNALKLSVELSATSTTTVQEIFTQNLARTQQRLDVFARYKEQLTHEPLEVVQTAKERHTAALKEAPDNAEALSMLEVTNSVLRERIAEQDEQRLTTQVAELGRFMAERAEQNWMRLNNTHATRAITPPGELIDRA